MPDLAGAKKMLEKLKSLTAAQQYNDARDLLTDIKVKMLDFTALPPVLEASKTQEQELVLARDLLENAVLLAVHAQARLGAVALSGADTC